MTARIDAAVEDALHEYLMDGGSCEWLSAKRDLLRYLFRNPHKMARRCMLLLVQQAMEKGDTEIKV